MPALQPHARAAWLSAPLPCFPLPPPPPFSIHCSRFPLTVAPRLAFPSTHLSLRAAHTAIFMACRSRRERKHAFAFTVCVFYATNDSHRSAAADFIYQRPTRHGAAPPPAVSRAWLYAVSVLLFLFFFFLPLAVLSVLFLPPVTLDGVRARLPILRRRSPRSASSRVASRAHRSSSFSACCAQTLKAKRVTFSPPCALSFPWVPRRQLRYPTHCSDVTRISPFKLVHLDRKSVV